MSEPRPSFQLDPVTLNKHEVIASYRVLATRYRRMAEAEERPLTRDALLDLARQCDVAAEQMGSSGRASRN